MLPDAAAAVCIAGIVVRVSVRDDFAPTAVLFYALPPAMLTLLAAFSCVAWCLTKRLRRAVAAAVTVVACGAWCLQTQFVFHPHIQPRDSRRVLFWNTARCVLGKVAVLDQIRELDADIIGLVETGEESPVGDRSWDDSLPGYRVEHFDGQMLIAAKGKLFAAESHKLGNDSRCHVAHILLNNEPLTLVLVDFDSDPFADRRGAFAKLRALLASHSSEPVLLMGDFNTPSDSLFFDDMRANMLNAFETAGNGYTATWPVPVPLIAIDQIWVNRIIEIRGCRLCWTTRSDHRAMVLEAVW